MKNAVLSGAILVGIGAAALGGAGTASATNDPPKHHSHGHSAPAKAHPRLDRARVNRQVRVTKRVEKRNEVKVNVKTHVDVLSSHVNVHDVDIFSNNHKTVTITINIGGGKKH